MSRRGALGIGAALVVGVVLVPGAPAAAHAELVSSEPANGATLEALPAEVVLTFSENVGRPAALSVTAADGDEVPGGELEVVDDTMRLPLAGTPTAPGHYLVAYQVTSADGHPVSGQLHFLVSGDADGDGAPDVAVPAVAGGGGDGSANASVTIAAAVLLAAALAIAVTAVRRVVRRLAVDDVA